MSGLFDVGAKALNIARFWPAGLASLVVGTAPTTGAIVGVVAISIFIIIIWLVIYSKCYITTTTTTAKGKENERVRWRLILSIFVNFHLIFTQLGIGVLPVGAALLGRQDFDMSSPYYPGALGHPGMMPQQPFQGPYPYNQRFQRSLADASRTVMDAIDKFQSKNN